MEWMFLPFRRYAEFQGRSRRKEYWMFALFLFIVYMVFLGIMFGALGTAFIGAQDGGPPGAGAMTMFAGAGIAGIVFLLFILAIIVPSIAVGVRRLHDTDRSGWWLLGPTAINLVALAFTGTGLDVVLSLVGFVASIALLVFMCLPGTNGPNRFGADPKGGVADLGDVFR